MVAYTFGNHVLRLHLRVAVKLNFRPYIQGYTSLNENFEYSYPLNLVMIKNFKDEPYHIYPSLIKNLFFRILNIMNRLTNKVHFLVNIMITRNRAFKFLLHYDTAKTVRCVCYKNLKQGAVQVT